MTNCPFCERARRADVDAANEVAVMVRDAFPVAPGHVLIVPRRHTSSLFELRRVEWDGVWALLRDVHGTLHEQVEPDGWNIGVNIGPAAGQTVEHAHVHLIPRRLGDVEDPRGGVRWVLPDRANYWGGDSTKGQTSTEAQPPS